MPPTILIIPDNSTLEEYYQHLMDNLNDKYLPPSPPSTLTPADPWASCHNDPPKPTASRTVTRRDRIY